jgi:multimeric flavodoxin WrbA
MIKAVFSELEKDGIVTELVQVGGKDLRGCRACGACRKNQDMKCVFGSDGINGYLEKMIASDVIIIGSPTYFADLTTEAKALIDRCGYVARSNGNPLKRKIGAAVVPMRRAGGIHVFDSINHFFTINEMIVPGSSYWNISIGEFEKDTEGVGTMKTLGSNIAWLANKLK